MSNIDRWRGPDGAEHLRARRWRETVVKLSRADLAKLVGFSAARIADIENGRGRSAPFHPVGEETMSRYRLACAAVTLGVVFDWESCTLEPRGPVKITIGSDPATILGKWV